MPSPTRRQVLGATVPATGLLAGCSSFLGGDTPTTRDESPAPGTLGAEGAVVARAGPSGPLTVEAAVTNESGESLRLLPSDHAGMPLEAIGWLESDAAALVPVPVDPRSVHVSGLTDSRVADCWRFLTDDGAQPEIVVEDTTYPVSLVAEETHAVRYGLYRRGTDGACHSAGTYRTAPEVAVRGGGTNGRLSVQYELTLPASGKPSFSASVKAENE